MFKVNIHNEDTKATSLTLFWVSLLLALVVFLTFLVFLLFNLNRSLQKKYLVTAMVVNCGYLDGVIYIASISLEN